MRFLLIILSLWILAVEVSGQSGPVWLYLQDDVRYAAVKARYSEELVDHYYSHWLHAIGTHLNEEQVQYMRAGGMIREVAGQAWFGPLSSSAQAEKLGFALEQIGAQLLIDRGLDGQGVRIGVIDGGFLNANTEASLQPLFANGLVSAYRDYITPGLLPYAGVKALDDRHGTDVLQLIGGNNSQTGVRHGLATASTYYLARTDHGASEKKIEEMYLIKALEWLDSLEVRLVNISLGYTDGFDNASDNYKPEDMNGQSALAKAVDHAFEKEGMLVVVSAGNDGDKDWQVLSTPADARGALTVGATKFKHWDKMDFSSVGVAGLGYIKPEVACFASEGTSFAAPIITGLAALIWQARPDLNNYEVKDMIMKSGHLYPFGNNYVGYGVPMVARILPQLDGEVMPVPTHIRVDSDRYVLRTRIDRHFVVYHKTDTWVVLEESYTRATGKKISVRRKENAAFTTIVVDNVKVYELEWTRE